jgi:UDP-MurNAc hydroxylase
MALRPVLPGQTGLNRAQTGLADSGIAFAFTRGKAEVPMSAQPVRFQVLSHAGLLVQGGGKSVLFDPWLVGSSYWRSWWNYPPLSKEALDSLRPDFICLTHIHWHHFHGPSLRRFDLATPILIPRVPSGRMKKDLRDMGFTHVLELEHGKALELASGPIVARGAGKAPGLRITSYQFHPFSDSAAMIECGPVTLFNASDARIGSFPIDGILARHAPVDFLFRSLGRLDDRMCFDYMDAPMRNRQEAALRLNAFSDFARRVGARHAIPMAGDQCFLHRETFHLNPDLVSPYQAEAPRGSGASVPPEVTAMAPGDSWSSDSGFQRLPAPAAGEREKRLREYAAAQSPALEKFYALEGRVETTLTQAEAYFRGFIAAVPMSVRRLFRGHQVTWVLTGRNIGRFWVDMERGVVREVSGIDDENHPLQIHTSAYVFRRCMAQNLFLHLPRGGRVLFRCRREDAKYIHLLMVLFNMYESGMLPAWKMLSPRFLSCWAPRWREAAHLAFDLIRSIRDRIGSAPPNTAAPSLKTERRLSAFPLPHPHPHPLSPGTAHTRADRLKRAEAAVPGGSQS